MDKLGIDIEKVENIHVFFKKVASPENPEINDILDWQAYEQ